MKMILLDTCALLWLAADQEQLSSKAVKTIEQHQGAVAVSSISAFEIAIKCRSGKLTLPLSTSKWFSQVIDFHGLIEIPVDGLISISSVELSPLHTDPCDRIIIATAKCNKIPIITSDKMMGKYDVQVIW